MENSIKPKTKENILRCKIIKNINIFHLLEKKFLVIQSPLCKKLFYLTCKYELTFWRTLKVFLTVLISHLLPKIYLFYETWIPTVKPNTEISSTF